MQSACVARAAPRRQTRRARSTRRLRRDPRRGGRRRAHPRGEDGWGRGVTVGVRGRRARRRVLGRRSAPASRRRAEGRSRSEAGRRRRSRGVTRARTGTETRSDDAFAFRALGVADGGVVPRRDERRSPRRPGPDRSRPRLSARIFRAVPRGGARTVGTPKRVRGGRAKSDGTRHRTQG